MQWAIKGREVCRFHGGLSPPAGPTHPAYKHGIYSKALPEHMRDIAAESAADENNLALNEAIGALDARLVQLMEGLSRESGGRQAWTTMRQLIDQMMEAFETENAFLYKQTVDKAKDILGQQFREFSIWEEIYNGFEVRRRLVETETKRREKAANQMSLDQVMTTVHQLGLILRRHIDDPHLLRMIALDLQSVMNAPSGSQLMNSTREVAAD